MGKENILQDIEKEYSKKVAEATNKLTIELVQKSGYHCNDNDSCYTVCKKNNLTILQNNLSEEDEKLVGEKGILYSLIKMPGIGDRDMHILNQAIMTKTFINKLEEDTVTCRYRTLVLKDLRENEL